MAVKKNIVEFDITVCYFVLVKVSDAFHDLPENKPSILLRQLSPLPDIIEQIATWTQLHDYHMMLVCLECLQYFDVVWVSQTFQYVYFIHYFLLLRFFFHEIHVYAFYGHQFSSEPMKSQIDLSKGSFA